MYVSSDWLTARNRDVHVTTRPDRDAAWTTPQPVAELSTTGLDDDSAELLGDGLHLVMSKGHAAGARSDARERRRSMDHTGRAAQPVGPGVRREPANGNRPTWR